MSRPRLSWVSIPDKGCEQASGQWQQHTKALTRDTPGFCGGTVTSCMAPREELAAEDDRRLLPQDWQSHHQGWGREPSSCSDAG